MVFLLHKNGDLYLHSSVQDAESAMESVDVEHGEYVRAFGESGNVLAIHTKPSVLRSFGGVDIHAGTLVPTSELAVAELSELLRARLMVGKDTAHSLRDLVALASQVFGAGRLVDRASKVD